MGRLKTHKTAIKRFKVTRRGKIVYRTKGWNHLRSKKDKKVRHRKRNPRCLSKPAAEKVKSLIKK